MAEEDKQNQQQDSQTQNPPKKDWLGWVILAVVVVICSGAGFLLARLFGGSSVPQSAQASGQEPAEQGHEAIEETPAESGKTWFYDLDPVVANLDEPGATRYVRATLTLEMHSYASAKKLTKLFEDKKPILTNWLTIYLASLSIEDIRGDRNLKRIQSQILDAFNQELFPDQKPMIKHILFKEFAIQ